MMKSIVSLAVVVFLVILVIQCSSSSLVVRKRYYDNWDANNAAGIGDNIESIKSGSNRHKGFNKHDPCENKPLWFLKSQARLGKISPFYDCLNEQRFE
ncbi:unnamed protein product [Adineta ricciae]|uniref:Uncharacterized protein n=1 Tax=Adineta ricciae TaxID=249248 RepID=A0A813VXC0_ADIRI|nr:unnamed protein product [Adineta ricciae]CAF0874159.1 unnamed protein product [Adineta ricciae]